LEEMEVKAPMSWMFRSMRLVGQRRRCGAGEYRST
jgi:hypothetical protein